MIPEFPWLELVGIRAVNRGEWRIEPVAKAPVQWKENAPSSWVYPIVRPANAYNCLRLEDLKIPDGHEADGETLKDAFRQPSIGDIYLMSVCPDAAVWGGNCKGDRRRLCLRKIKPKTKRVLVTEEELVPHADYGSGFISTACAEICAASATLARNAGCTARSATIAERMARWLMRASLRCGNVRATSSHQLRALPPRSNRPEEAQALREYLEARAARKAKKERPDRYCAHPSCLWRGADCPKPEHQKYNDEREVLGMRTEDGEIA